MKAEKIVCIFAHPDDESWVCGGSIASFVQRGHHVELLTLTRGESFTQTGRRLSATAAARTRKRELHKSSKLLGIRKFEIFNFPDRGLAGVSRALVRATVSQRIRAYRPTMVCTFAADGVTGHADHRTVFLIVRELLRHREFSYIKKIMYFTAASSALRKKYGGRSVRTPGELRHIDVRQFAARKHRAIACHQSQVIMQQRLLGLSTAAVQMKIGREHYYFDQR